MKPIITILCAIVFLNACTSATDSKQPKQEEVANTETTTINAEGRQLNINILWDLSDRIDSLTNPASPQHYERDIKAIETITSFFKKDMEKRGAFKAKGRIRVFYADS